MSDDEETAIATDDDDRDDGPRQNQLVRRSFEGVATLMNNAATQALVAKATADINARWMIAMHRPRDLNDVRQVMMHECKRPKFAKAAIYAVPRAGGTVKGMTIRFAEAAMKAMGNMGVEAQTLFDSDDERTVRVTVTDFEGNSTWSRDLTIKKTKIVKKNPGRHLGERLNSYGEVNFIVNASDDDVTMKEASAISKASRTGILRMVPAWLIAECQEKCEQVQKDADAQDPDAARRELFDAFAQMGARPSWIADWLGHPIDQSTPPEILEIRQLYRALRDGDLTLDEAMKRKRGTPADKPASGVAAAVAKPAPKATRQAAKPVEPAPPTQDEQAEIARQEREAAK